MKFKINQSFAANYDERRRKEELSKLKSKYGDIPLEEEEGGSSSESETDDDWERNVLNDTRDLELLEALKSGDPRIKDPSYRWFSSSESEGAIAPKASKKEKSSKPLFLRDLERRRLIGNSKEEAMDQDLDQGEEMKAKPANTDLTTLKQAFKVNDSDEDEDGEAALFTLAKSVTASTIASSDVIMKPTDKNDDEVLLSYIKMITKKANEPKVNEHNSSADDEREEDDSADEELFFTKGAEFEEQWNNRHTESTDLESQFPRTFAVFRSEEADRDFIKSHPRTIADSMRQPREGKLSRSEKNRARRDRVKREKEQKLARIGAELDAKVEAEIRELRRLKMESVEDRVEKIRRTADNNKLQLDARFLEEDWDPAQHDKLIQRAFDQHYDENQQEETKPVFSDDDELDKDLIDWDSWKPSTSGTAASVAKPAGEDPAPDLMEVDEEGRGGHRGRRRKRRHRAVGFRGALERAYKRGRLANDVGRYSREDFPEGFEEFIDKVYAFDCEDIIPGHGEEQEDVKCRFRYRSTVPNDFGLSVDEILCAPAKELNSWASLKKVVQYRTDDEETRDKKVYCSDRRQVLKGRFLPTVFTPLSENEGVGDEEEKTEGEAVVQKKKKKKHKKKSLMSGSSQVTTMETDAPLTDAASSDVKIFSDGQKQGSRKKAWANKQKPYIPKATDIVSESRLNKLLRGKKE